GEFGVQPLLEGQNNDSFFTAQNLDLGKWDTIANAEVDDASVPHLTVLATGNGEKDYFSFTITQAMWDAAKGSGTFPVSISVVFDIDRGFEPGDAFWGSKFRLFDESERLLAEAIGSGVFDAGSISPSDAFLRFTFVANSAAEAADKTYFLEIDGADGGGLPVGVDYDLRVSIQRHPVA